MPTSAAPKPRSHVLHALLLMMVGGCTRAAPTGEAGPPRVSTTVAIAPPVVSTQDAATASAPSFTCKLEGSVETIDEGQVLWGGPTDLENARVRVDDARTIVTWERQSSSSLPGDPFRSPMAAVRPKDGRFRVVEFPVDSYACATYGYIAPNTAEHPFVTWGISNKRGFELWKDLPQTTKDPLGRNVPKTPSERTVLTRKQEVHSFAISRNVALAATSDGACDAPYCHCSDKPITKGLWIHSLDKERPFSTRIATSPLSSDAPSAPAIVMDESHGLAAYRADKALHLVWLDRDGRPRSPPTRFDEGDVGAPALAIAGSNVIVVWARRESKTDPYTLRWMNLAPNATPSSPRTIATVKSAFAPAVVADARSMVVAWMEGDSSLAARTGEIHLGRVALDAESPMTGVVLSGADEPNARDPELSGSVDAPAVVWGSFTKPRPGGVVKFARASCAVSPL